MIRSITESEGRKQQCGVKSNNLIRKILVTMRIGDTPVLIPNTMVKTYAADGTMLETIWESRWLPDLRAYSSAG